MESFSIELKSRMLSELAISLDVNIDSMLVIVSAPPKVFVIVPAPKSATIPALPPLELKLTWSVPEPPSKVSVDESDPPSKTSLPLPPIRESLPPKPERTSLPSRPLRVLLISLPQIVLAKALPVPLMLLEPKRNNVSRLLPNV